MKQSPTQSHGHPAFPLTMENVQKMGHRVKIPNLKITVILY